MIAHLNRGPFWRAIGQLAIASALILGAGGVSGALAQSYGYESGYEDDSDYPSGDYDSNDGYSNDNGAYGDQNGSYRPEEDDTDDYEDGQDAPDVTYFYDELEADGRWVRHARYGQVWIPNGVDDEWRPYTRGRWTYTDEYGWYWVSDEPFGWATYHYGRWYFDDRYGWVWVPGTRWGPAWVAWRSSDAYIGWAPLPPDAYWEPRRGLRYDVAIYESPSFSIYWSFIQPTYITTHNVYRHCAPRREARTIIYRTRPQTDYAFVNRRIVNRGIPIRTVERVTRTRIKPMRLTATDDRALRRAAREDGNQIRVFRPKLTRFNGARDRKAGRPAVDRSLFRDVDRRKVRRQKVRASPFAPPNGAPALPSAKPADDNKRQPHVLPPGGTGATPGGPDSVPPPANNARTIDRAPANIGSPFARPRRDRDDDDPPPRVAPYGQVRDKPAGGPETAKQDDDAPPAFIAPPPVAPKFRTDDRQRPPKPPRTTRREPQQFQPPPRDRPGVSPFNAQPRGRPDMPVQGAGRPSKEERAAEKAARRAQKGQQNPAPDELPAAGGEAEAPPPPPQ